MTWLPKRAIVTCGTRVQQSVVLMRLLVVFTISSKIFPEKGFGSSDFDQTIVVAKFKPNYICIVYCIVYAARKFGVTIIHRFLEKGHTQNEGESVHSVIERTGEHRLIYTPEEWKLLIKWANTENPYDVRDVFWELVFLIFVHLDTLCI